MNRTKILFFCCRCRAGRVAGMVAVGRGAHPGRGVRQAEPPRCDYDPDEHPGLPGLPVGADTVELLLRAAMAAPSAVNRQPWAFVVVDDGSCYANSPGHCPLRRWPPGHPLAVVVCGDLSRNPGASGRLVGDGCLGGLGKPAPCGPCPGVGSRMDWGLSPRRTGRGRAARAGASLRCRSAQPDSGGLSCGQS